MSRVLPFLVLLAACSDPTSPAPHELNYDAEVAGTWTATVTDTAGCDSTGRAPFLLNLRFAPHAVKRASGFLFIPDLYDLPMTSSWTAGELAGYLSGEISDLYVSIYVGTGGWRSSPRPDTSSGASLGGHLAIGTDSLYGELYDPERSPIDSLGTNRNPLFGHAGCVYQVHAVHVQ
jgi:hypothetical protein